MLAGTQQQNALFRFYADCKDPNMYAGFGLFGLVSLSIGHEISLLRKMHLDENNEDVSL